METRVAEMEAELQALRRTVAALAPSLTENILRELTARSAMLVVKAPTEEMVAVVEKAVVVAVEENAVAEEKEAKAANEDNDATTRAAVVEAEEEDDDEEEQVMEAEDTVATAVKKDEDPRMEVTTSQESSASGSSSSSSASSDSDDATLLSLNAFEEAVSCRKDPALMLPPPPPPVRLPSRPPMIPTSKSKTQKRIDDWSSSPKKPEPPLVSKSRGPSPKPVRVPTQASTSLYVPQAKAPSPARVEVQVSTRVSPPVRHPPSPPTSKQSLVPPPKPIKASVSVESSTPTSLPADFEVQTRDSVGVAWEKWCCGDLARGFPPLRTITTKQVTVKAVSRRLSDLRCAMQPIEAMAMASGLWKSECTPHEAAAVFAQLEDHLPIYAPAVPDGRKRKKDIAWSTALNNMRKKRKQQAEDRGDTVDQILI